MSIVGKDVAYAVRTLRRSPGFAITAIATIALGIAASTAIFSVVNAILLRPLPYADPQRLVLIWGDMRNRNVTDFPFPPADYADLKKQGTLFEDIGAVTTGRVPLSDDDGEPEQIRIGATTTNFFTLLGARVPIGRNFIESDGTPQGPPPGDGAIGQPPPPPAVPASVILSHEFWQRRYGGDRSILGRFVEIGGQRSEVVGVLEPGFELLFPPGTNTERTPDVWTALRVDFAAGSRINVFLQIIGRLKAGVTVPQAQAQVDRIAGDLRRQFPIKESAGLYIRVEPMHEDLVSDVRPGILALMGAAVFVLLIACANVANLLLVRLSRRERELSVRAALGGSRGVLIRQLLIESLVIAGAGAVLGTLLAWMGIDVLLALAPDTLPRTDSVSLHPLVLGFAAISTLIAAVLFGMVPALRAGRADLMHVLRTSGRTSALGAGAKLRNAVVTGEVALAFILLVGCGLMMRSFIASQRANPGFDADNLLTFVVQNARLQTPESRQAYMSQVRERLAAIPGVTSVTAAQPLPLDGGIANARWGTEQAVTDASAFQQADVHIVLPGYFETMRTPLLAGRDFTEADSRPDANLVVIDRLVAEKAFPGQSPIGKRLYIRARTAEPEWYEVIGLVEHQRNVTPAADSREALFFADGYFFHGAAGRWAVRTTGEPTAITPAVRTAVGQIDALVPVAEVQPMRSFVDLAMAPTRFAFALITMFAVIAGLLAAVGLYGVLSTSVGQRTAEIGVRMVFGAPKSSIFQLVIGHGLRLTIIGVTLGLIGAFAVTRVMESMLVDISPTDPLTFAGIAVVFIAVAMAACWIPARRAAGLDPAAALREE